MTFYASMSGSLTTIQWAELLLRVVAAAICGWLVGVERSRRFKDAGVRTHSMVACSAALLMIISKYGFADLVMADGSFFPGARGADAARIASQVVSGVGFLGAGVIYRDRKFTTRGLTTAAGIWAVAGIGMAIGAGLYVIGMFSTALIIFMQFIMHRYSVGGDRYSTAGLDVVFSRDGDADEELYRQLEKWGVIVTETQIEKRPDGSMEYHLGLKLKREIKGEMLNNFVNAHSEVISIKMTNMQLDT